MGKSTDKKTSKKGSSQGKEKGTSKASKDKKGSSSTLTKDKGKAKNAKEDVATPIPVAEEMFMSITIETLRNVKTRVPGRAITVHAQDIADFQYDSPVIELTEGETPLQWQFDYPCFPSKPGWLDELAANPLFFTLFEIVGKDKGSDKDKKAGKDKKADKDKKKESKTEQNVLKQENVIGNCSLDLLPFLLGETRVRQVLLVEQDLEAYGYEMLTWPNLPQLTVCASVEQRLVSEQDVSESNMLFITLESLYNPPANMTEDLFYQAATGVPIGYNKTRDVVFDMGVWTEQRDVDKMKRWIGFANVGGRGAYSSYRLERDCKSLKNNLRVDLEKTMNQEAPRIEWNTLRRCWINDAESECIQNYISKNRWWPLEILVDEKSSEDTDSKGKLKELDPSSIHLTAFFDVSALLYPGVTKTRAISQVYTFCQEDMLARCGISRSLYAPAPPEVEIGESDEKQKEKQKTDGKGSSKDIKKKSSSKVTDKSSSKGGKGKKGAKETKSKSSSKIGGKGGKASKGTTKKEVPRPPHAEVPPEIMDAYSAPLFTDDGKPVFVLFELQVLKPFRVKRPVEEAVKDVDKLIQGGRGKPPAKVMTPALAETHFKECVEDLAAQINAEYQAFIDAHGGDDDEACTETDLQEQFYTYLQDGGFYQSIKETLRDKITNLVREKMGYGFDIKERREFQTFLCDLYVYLMEQIHTIVNNMMGVGAPAAVPAMVTDEDLYFFAKEATEQGNYETAERFFEDLISRDKENPVWWLEFAVYHMGLSNWSKAAQLVLEASLLDSRNKMALLLYALLMSQLGEEKTAFMFFDALTSIYPLFMEGWLAFHLYNLKTKRHDGAAAALQYAEKCGCSLGRDVIAAPVVDTDPIGWSSKMFPPDRSIFLQTAVLLLKLHATFYAEMALAQELMCDGRSLEYAYYLGVCHYLEGRYADALVHLDEALIGHRKQLSLWALRGHCYYRMEDRDNTLDHYKFIVESGEDVADLHMVALRLAEFSLEEGDFEDAKLYFLTAAKHRSSPRCWLGTAIACYNTNEFLEAEKALVEANYLDNMCPTTWAFLALVNLQFHRQTEFEQCYCQAIKSNFQDKNVLKCIHALRESLKYPDPCPLQSDKELQQVAPVTETCDRSTSICEMGET